MGRIDEERLPRPLMDDERRAIARLRRVLKDWPGTLEFHAGTGGLNVLVLDPVTLDNYYRESTSRDPRIDDRSIVLNLDVPAEGGDPY